MKLQMNLGVRYMRSKTMKSFATFASKLFSLHKNTSNFHRVRYNIFNVFFFSTNAKATTICSRKQYFSTLNIIQHKGVENVLSPREMMFVWVKDFIKNRVNLTPKTQNGHKKWQSFAVSLSADSATT
uniref:Uncharacterized protein n=1 Tax=Glossina pallidipes TaxID=7398 RepID=A0A1A9ZZE1_GLOPL